MEEKSRWDGSQLASKDGRAVLGESWDDYIKRKQEWDKRLHAAAEEQVRRECADKAAKNA